ncbi:stress response protein YsnF [Arthrobacter sp. CAN_A214]|uniref:YsnF/AvaK domain-containing protein n=1 Tax=Arthrobacter sp. CAN_A214 TaxID=2787720 RepID=UPI0018CA226D
MVTRKQEGSAVGDFRGFDRATDVPAPAAGISGHVNKKAPKGSGRAAALPEADVPSTTTGPTGRKGRKRKKMAGTTATGGKSTGAGDLAAGTVGRSDPDQPAGQVIVRSEEQVRVITQTKQLGRVRLSKTVVIENVPRTITVRREEIRIEHVPDTDAASAVGPGASPAVRAGSGAAPGVEISSSELENGGYSIVLSEERPVVRMETVAVKRIRLSKDMILTEESLTADVRKEVVDTGTIAGSAPEKMPAARSTDDYAG